MIKFFRYKKHFLFFGIIIILMMISFYCSHKVTAAPSLSSRLQGYILLQVEDNGEAWYVVPKEGERVYMQNGSSAYQIMRYLSLGITDADLSKIPVGIEPRFNDQDQDKDGLSDRLEEGLGTDPLKADTDNDSFSDGEELKNNFNPLGASKLSYNTTLTNRLKGYILLQVEKQGQAWYLNPSDGKRYYMQDGDAAYAIMRFLSLGITNQNLNQIRVSTRTFSVNTTPPGSGSTTPTPITPAPTTTPPTTPPSSGGGGGTPTTPPVTTPDYDSDNDGYNAVANGGDDCNDSSASIYPGATEVCGNSVDEDCSGADLVCTIADTQSPTTPTNLIATPSGTQITLSWTASTDNVGVTQYLIERSTSQTTGFIQIATSNTTSYTNTGLTNSTTYYYRIRAQDLASNTSAYSSTAQATTAAVVTDITPPSIPTNLLATPSGTQITLSWTASTDNTAVTGYQILRSTTNGSGYTQIATSNTNSYTNTGLNYSTTYYYVVRAYDAAGNTSANSSQAQATIEAAPVAGSPTISGLSSATLVDGQSYTISGSGFGVKSPVEPIKWDSFENGSVGEAVSNGWFIGRVTGDYPLYSDLHQRASQDLISVRQDFLTPGQYNCDLGFYRPDGSYKYFISFYRYLYLHPSITESRNYKIMGIRSGVGASSREEPELRHDIYPTTNTGHTYFANCDDRGIGSDYNAFEFNTNTWERFDYYADAGDLNVANAYYKHWLNGLLKTSYQNLLVRNRECDPIWTNIILSAYYSRESAPYVQCSDGCPAEIWIDDAYIDTTYARIEICDSSSWDESKQRHCEIQIPHTTWTDGQIQITANRGSFTAGQSAYLYVVEANGNVNSNGYPINF